MEAIALVQRERSDRGGSFTEAPRFPVSVFGSQAFMVFSMATWQRYEERRGPLAELGTNPRGVRSLLWAMLFEATGLPEEKIGTLRTDKLEELVTIARRLFDVSLPKKKKSEEEEAVAGEDKKPDDLEWDELLAMAIYDLRLTEEQFWRMSPRFFASLVGRFDLAIERHFLASSIITAQLTNIHLKEGALPLDPFVFSPTKQGNIARAKIPKKQKEMVIGKLLGLKEALYSGRAK